MNELISENFPHDWETNYATMPPQGTLQRMWSHESVRLSHCSKIYLFC